MTDKDLTAFELASVKKQIQRIKALGSGTVTIKFQNHCMVNIGIFAEIDVKLTNTPSTLDNPNQEAELRD